MAEIINGESNIIIYFISLTKIIITKLDKIKETKNSYEKPK